MITLSRKTTLLWVLSPTAFQAINQQALVVLERPLGNSVSAVNKMLACGEEMEMLLPEILGISPKANSTDWQRHLQDYWHNFGFDVPEVGYPLDISMTFDVTDFKRIDYIKSIATRASIKLSGNEEESQKAQESLFKYIVKNVKETEYYRYFSPVNVDHYLKYRFCLVNAKVANDPKDMRKSNNIDFYLLDEKTLAENRKRVNEQKVKSMDAYYNLIKKEDSINIVENMLIANESVLGISQLKEMEDYDKTAMLMDIAVQEPEKFLTLINDPILERKAEIKKWVFAGLVRLLPNSNTHTDASNPSIILGNNLDEVVSFVTNDVNASYVNDIRLQYKSINI